MREPKRDNTKPIDGSALVSREAIESLLKREKPVTRGDLLRLIEEGQRGEDGWGRFGRRGDAERDR